MPTKLAENPGAVLLYVLAVVIGAALISWGWRPSTGNGAALIVVGILLVSYAGFRFYRDFVQD